MSYTLANAAENGDTNAKECAICDRVATQDITVLDPTTGEPVTLSVCRHETKADVLEAIA